MGFDHIRWGLVKKYTWGHCVGITTVYFGTVDRHGGDDVPDCCEMVLGGISLRRDLLHKCSTGTDGFVEVFT